jgi:hypothetical protein
MTARGIAQVGLLKVGPEQRHTAAEKLVPPNLILLVDELTQREGEVSRIKWKVALEPTGKSSAKNLNEAIPGVPLIQTGVAEIMQKSTAPRRNFGSRTSKQVSKGFNRLVATRAGCGSQGVPSRHDRRCRDLIKANFADLDVPRMKAVASTTERGPIDRVEDQRGPIELFTMYASRVGEVFWNLIADRYFRVMVLPDR